MGTPSNGNANSKEDKPSSCNKKLTQPASIIASSGENTLGDCSNAPMEIPQEDHAVEEALNPLERETKGTDSAPVKPLEPPDATRETYTVPSYARWFSWNMIHEIERKSLKEFFDGSSSSKTPKIYKEYRDFMINMYREDLHRGVTFTEVRKMLIGDVNSLHKIFDFLETWGLINFQVSLDSKLEKSTEDAPIVFDNVTPPGIFVGLPSNPIRRVNSSNVKSSEVDRTIRGVQGATLASYKDVFNEVADVEVSTVSERASTGSERQPTVQRFCNNCRTECTANHFDCKKAGFVLCTKCFQDGNYGLGLSAADFKYSNEHKITTQLGSDKWTDEETFLLLEGILLYGDDWNSVVQHVGTKNEADCVMKLIHLPFGEHFMGNAGTEGNDGRSSNIKNENKVNDQAFSLKDSSAQNYQEDDNEEERHATKEDNTGPPLKYRRLNRIEDASNPIISQVAFLSTMVGPRVAAAAAESAVAALCQEDPSASHILNSLETKPMNHKLDSTLSGLDLESTRKECELEESKKEPGGNDQDTKDIDSYFSAKKLPPSNLQIRAAIGTALGAAAAHAKLIADQEEREMEHLISIVIENQLKKLHYKIQHFDELEDIMEKEHALMEQTKELLLAERLRIVQKMLGSKSSGSR
jgi:SWI/SNF related-matrix-associated actin-dependent regulator of chromatin subfamily C